MFGSTQSAPRRTQSAPSLSPPRGRHTNRRRFVGISTHTNVAMRLSHADVSRRHCRGQVCSITFSRSGLDAQAVKCCNQHQKFATQTGIVVVHDPFFALPFFSQCGPTPSKVHNAVQYFNIRPRPFDFQELSVRKVFDDQASE